MAVANDQRLVSIEREIARIKGKVTRVKGLEFRLSLIPCLECLLQCQFSGFTTLIFKVVEGLDAL